jgi:phage shock protein A
MIRSSLYQSWLACLERGEKLPEETEQRIQELQSQVDALKVNYQTSETQIDDLRTNQSALQHTILEQC